MAITNNKGITLLLVVVILSAISAISIGIFNVIIGELLISGDIADSFIAFYAADEGIEKTLYRDRRLGELTDGQEETQQSVLSGACYSFKITKNTETTIRATGQYRCETGTLRVVKRGFLVRY